MKKIIIGLAILVLAITAISVGLIHSQNQAQEQLALQATLPTVENLIKKVEENVDKIQDLRAEVKETEQEMNISEKEFSIKEVLRTTEYTFLFKKPDMIKIIPKHKDGVPKNREELNNFYKQHPDWTEDQKLKYYSDEYLSQNVDLINIGQVEYYVERGTRKLTDKMPFGGPTRPGSWSSLLEPQKLHLVHKQLRKLLEPFIMQNALTVKKDEKNPDVYIIKGKFTPHDVNPHQTSPYGWDWDVWEPGGDDEIELKIDYKRGFILQASWYLVDNFQMISNILLPTKFVSWEPVKAEDKNPKYIQVIKEFSSVEINKGIRDEEFLFDNTKGYDISRYRIKLLNEK